MSIKKAEPRHQEFRNDILAVLGKHAGHLDASEMLALAAHLTGQILAMQDQRRFSPAAAMDIVGKNIEQGNAEAIAEVTGKSAGLA